MLVFMSNIVEHRALDKRLRQEGRLTLRTRIEIRGDHRRGPVPVNVIYESAFVPDEKYWERDELHPDDEPYSVSYLEVFDDIAARECHCSTIYELLPLEAD
jgi:hypothetical protein